ncbi:hypothetical protein RF11_04927 [Thelohanellus kitauei]|uniref:Uncharacterized protein n=1 Tax=Thelohanellus kitauei TaxID=669202 RepID=A0A0C2JMH6_THEKT|nr:hypothetical protein RF11_04927 [Thelohanellus kitauei]
MKEKYTNYNQDSESQRLSDQAFAFDLFEHIHELKIRHRGKYIFFSLNLSQNIKTRIQKLETMPLITPLTKKHNNMVSSLDNEYTIRLEDFQKLIVEFEILCL